MGVRGKDKGSLSIRYIAAVLRLTCRLHICGSSSKISHKRDYIAKVLHFMQI